MKLAALSRNYYRKTNRPTDRPTNQPSITTEGQKEVILNNKLIHNVNTNAEKRKCNLRYDFVLFRANSVKLLKKRLKFNFHIPFPAYCFQFYTLKAGAGLSILGHLYFRNKLYLYMWLYVYIHILCVCVR